MEAMSANQMRLRVINSEYHAWMVVPLAALRVRDMEDLISMHSSVDYANGNAYLEEDVDARLFLERIMLEGVDPVIEDISTADDSFIKRLPRFRPSPESF